MRDGPRDASLGAIVRRLIVSGHVPSPRSRTCCSCRRTSGRVLNAVAHDAVDDPRPDQRTGYRDDHPRDDARPLREAAKANHGQPCPSRWRSNECKHDGELGYFLRVRGGPPCSGYAHHGQRKQGTCHQYGPRAPLGPRTQGHGHDDQPGVQHHQPPWQLRVLGKMPNHACHEPQSGTGDFVRRVSDPPVLDPRGSHRAVDLLSSSPESPSHPAGEGGTLAAEFIVKQPHGDTMVLDSVAGHRKTLDALTTYLSSDAQTIEIPSTGTCHLCPDWQPCARSAW